MKLAQLRGAREDGEGERQDTPSGGTGLGLVSMEECGPSGRL